VGGIHLHKAIVKRRVLPGENFAKGGGREAVGRALVSGGTKKYHHPVNNVGSEKRETIRTKW